MFHAIKGCTKVQEHLDILLPVLYIVQQSLSHINKGPGCEMVGSIDINIFVPQAVLITNLYAD